MSHHGAILATAMLIAGLVDGTRATAAPAQARPAQPTAATTSTAVAPTPRDPGQVTATEPAAAPNQTQAPTATQTQPNPQPTSTTGSYPPPTTPAGSSATPPGTAATPVGTRTPTPTVTLVPAWVIPHEERPIIVVRSTHLDPGRPNPGTEFTLKLEVANVGEHFAENVKLGLSGDQFAPVSGSSTLYLGNIDEGDDETVSVRLRVGDSVTPGLQNVTVTLAWDDSYGLSYQETTTIGIEVGGDSLPRPFILMIGSRVPSRVAPGVPFAAVLDLANTGGGEARNVVVSPVGGPLAAAGSGMGGPVNLPAGGTASVTLRLIAGTVSEQQAVSQPLEIKYRGPDGQQYTESQSIGVVVIAETPFGALPIVSSYTIDVPGRSGAASVETLHPGEVFELAITVTNAGVEAAYRARMTLGGIGGSSSGAAAPASLGPFAPVGSGNVRFLDSLLPGETRPVEQTMVVNGAATSGVHALPVAFDYVDSQGKPQTSQEVISLLVGQRVEIDIRPIDIVSSTLVGSTTQFAAEIINASADEVRIGRAEVVGDDVLDVSEASRFIGPLDSGSADVIDAQVTARRAGTGRLTVKVGYTDDFNRPQVVEQQFEIHVAAAPPTPEGEVEAREAPSGNILMRILRGLFGLGASPPSEPPVEEGDALPRPGASDRESEPARAAPVEGEP